MAAAKKSIEKKSNKEIAPKSKRKLMLQSSDSEASSPPHLTKKLRTIKYNQVSRPFAPKLVEAVPISQVPVVPKLVNSINKLI